jgi:hypothetical protein
MAVLLNLIDAKLTSQTTQWKNNKTRNISIALAHEPIKIQVRLHYIVDSDVEHNVFMIPT